MVTCVHTVEYENPATAEMVQGPRSKVQGPRSGSPEFEVGTIDLLFGWFPDSETLDRGPWTVFFGLWTLDLGPWTLDLGPLLAAERLDNVLARGAARRPKAAEHSEETGQRQGGSDQWEGNPEIESDLAKGVEVARAGTHAIYW